MSRILWLALGLTLCMLVQGDVSVRYTDCPQDCKCVKNLMVSVMTCNKMFTDNLVHDMPITHFELTGVKEPVTLSENVFVKMGLTHVKVIKIVNSNIESIDKNAFNGLSELSQIVISDSKVSKIHPDTFKNIKNLKTLQLSGNPLSDVVIHSETLEQLVLSNCKLSDITERLFEFIPVLTFLDLSENNIQKLTSNAFDTLMNLEEINLSFNHLTEIPKDLFATNDLLNTLNLSNNPISSFSGDEFEDLEILDLSNCLIDKIDSKMFKNMNRLNDLDISSNKIADIEPKAFVDMTELKVIDLSGNQIRVLNENVFAKNNNLQKIRLDNNIKLTKLPNFNAVGYNFAVHYFSCNNCNLKGLSKYTFKNMPGLISLFLAHNNINDISTGVFQNLTSLIEVDLSYNDLITIDDDTFKHNTDLQKLVLSFNPLKALHASMFKENINLKILELSSCGLYQLWTAPTKLKLPSIQSLNISNNNIQIITEADILVTKGLKSLDISKNPLECNEDLTALIFYLTTKQIKNTQYLTHEKQSYDFEDRDKNVTTWREIARARCPDLLPEDEDDELDDNFDDEDEDFGDATESDIVYETDFPSGNKFNDFQVIPIVDEEQDEILLPLKHNNIEYRYSLMWPVLIFLGTALAVLGLVANVILFVIRRKQSIPVPRIINVPKISSRLKTNSGLVYQQLSEEHGPKTPILGRFTPIVGVQGNQNDPENV